MEYETDPSDAYGMAMMFGILGAMIGLLFNSWPAVILVAYGLASLPVMTIVACNRWL